MIKGGFLLLIIFIYNQGWFIVNRCKYTTRADRAKQLASKALAFPPLSPRIRE